jgi:nitroreductase
MNMEIINALNWRYATKGYSDKQLSEEQLGTVLEAMRLSASSFGLQPWKFIVVRNPDLRKKLRAAAWDQPAVTDASAIIVLAVNKHVDDAYIDTYVAFTAKERGVPVEALSGFADMMKGSIKGKTSAEVEAWSKKQVYIALGTGLTTAALLNIDATPMEGFAPEQVDEVLGLPALGLGSAVFLALGFRSEADATAKYKKVRFDAKDIIINM